MKPISTKLFSTPQFLPLFVAQFFGSFNDNAFRYGLTLLLTFKLSVISTTPIATLTALATGLFILPYFLFSAIAGQLADRYEKRRLVRFVKMAEIVIMVVIAVGFVSSLPLLLYVALFALGLHSSVFSPLKYSLIPELVDKDNLFRANAFMEAGNFIAVLTGTVVGGTLIMRGHGEWLISGLLILFAVIGYVSSTLIPKSAQLPSEQQTPIDWNPLTSTWQVVRQAVSEKSIRLCMLGISWFWLLGVILVAQLTPLVKICHNAGESVSTLLTVVSSIGLACGSLACVKLMKGHISARHVPLAALGISIFVIDLALAADSAGRFPDEVSVKNYFSSLAHMHVAVDIFLVTFCAGVFLVPLNTLLQKLSPPEKRASIIAANNVVNALFMVTASVLVMIVSECGVRLVTIFLWVGILNIGVAIYTIYLLPYELMQMLLHRVFKIIYKLEVVGLENFYNAKGNVLIISNHVAFIDPLALAAALPERLSFAVNDRTSQRWWAKPAMLFADPHPMSPGNPMAIKGLVEKLRSGRKCVIYPEGRLTRTGGIMKIYEGTALIAQQTASTLLPVHISGAEHSIFNFLGKKYPKHFLPRITITIHPPVTWEKCSNRKTAAHKIQRLMSESSVDAANKNRTLWEELIYSSRKFGRHLPIVGEPENDPISYQELLKKASILGSLLEKHILPNETAGFLLPNCCAAITTFFAFQSIARTPAMINHTSGVANVVAACKAACIQKIITSKRFIEQGKLEEFLANLLQTLPELKIIYLEDLRDEMTFADKLFGYLDSLRPLSHHRSRLLRLISNDELPSERPAVVLFTSGSSGTPKGVVLSHRNLLTNCAQMRAMLNWTTEDSVLNALPIFHSFGLTGGVLLPLFSGCKINLYPTPLHYKIIPEYAYDTNTTVLLSTDTFLRAYGRTANPYDFYSVRHVFAGAEKLKEDTQALWMERFGIKIYEGYGMTEASPVVAFNNPIHSLAETVGTFLPCIAYRLEPIEGIASGGRLFIKGGNIMKGYLLAESPGKLQPPVDGWHDTGDIVEIDEEGFVKISGRAKRFAKIGGEMVSLTVVEELAASVWPDKSHAALIVPHPTKGETIVLISECADVSKEKYTAEARKRGIPELAVPRSFVFKESIPKTATGKPDYPSLEKWLADESKSEEPILQTDLK